MQGRGGGRGAVINKGDLSVKNEKEHPLTNQKDIGAYFTGYLECFTIM